MVGVIATAEDRPIAAMRGIHACRKALGDHLSVESMRAIGVRLESFGQHWEWALKFAIPQVIERFGKSFELSTFDKALEILAEGTAKVGYNAPVLPSHR